MADTDNLKDTKNYFLDVPMKSGGSHVRGASAYDWGMQNRLARIFRPSSGKTVMFAIDHGYFQGPTAGLERVDVTIVPLLQYADALMCTRGILRSTIPTTFTNGVVLRASGGPSILKELSNEQIAMDVEDAARLNASAMAVQVFVGGEFETQSIQNMTKLVDAGLRYGVPVLGVTAVGKNMVRDARYFRLACRICAELGAQVVKTYYVADEFETITASCPVPIVMAGGKKLPELDALTMAYRAVQEGAAGVDMGRNIFQSDAPEAMMKAIGQVVHEGLKPERAFDLYQTLKHEAGKVGAGA
jgi:putative autoinducer-2 (AI-2) aldolase